MMTGMIRVATCRAGFCNMPHRVNVSLAICVVWGLCTTAIMVGWWFLAAKIMLIKVDHMCQWEATLCGVH